MKFTIPIHDAIAFVKITILTLVASIMLFVSSCHTGLFSFMFGYPVPASNRANHDDPLWIIQRDSIDQRIQLQTAIKQADNIERRLSSLRHVSPEERRRFMKAVSSELRQKSRDNEQLTVRHAPDSTGIFF